MKKRLFIALIIILMLVPSCVAQAKKPLEFDTTYTFSAIADPPSDPVVCDIGKGLAWVGTVEGTVEGVPVNGNIYYCMHSPDDLDYNRLEGNTNHWEDAVFEIWVGGVLVLRGEESGSTTADPGKDGIWQANGIVTEASEEFEDWIGRQVHDGGEFTWTVIETPDGPLTIPESGGGEFRTN